MTAVDVAYVTGCYTADDGSVLHANFIVIEGIPDCFVVAGVQAFDAGCAATIFLQDEPDSFPAEFLGYRISGGVNVVEPVSSFSF